MTPARQISRACSRLRDSGRLWSRKIALRHRSKPGLRMPRQSFVGTASRSIARQDAYDRSYKAVINLLQFDPQLLAVKYCSTFDSLPEGNIGASIDAAMDATAESFTVALPALPSLGRTTYMGYHFVHEKLLSDSTLRHHPLNPMTNSYLPSHLQSQTKRSVGLVTYANGKTSACITERLNQLRKEGTSIALLDCIDEAHLERNVEAIADMRLITGSSGWATTLPRIWRERGLHGPPANDLVPRRTPGGRGILIVSGSCSQATRAQNNWMKHHGGCVVLDLGAALLLERGHDWKVTIDTAAQTLLAGGTCLLTTAELQSAADLHAGASVLGLNPVDAGERIVGSLGSLVKQIVNMTPPQGLIIAGGETSSSLMRTLELGGLRIGPNIEPGVPVCIALSRPNLGIVLKSGNFGSSDFFARACSAILDIPLGSAY